MQDGLWGKLCKCKVLVVKLQAIQLVGVLRTKQEVMFRVVKLGWGYKGNIQPDDTFGCQWLKLFQ